MGFGDKSDSLRAPIQVPQTQLQVRILGNLSSELPTSPCNLEDLPTIGGKSDVDISRRVKLFRADSCMFVEAT